MEIYQMIIDNMINPSCWYNTTLPHFLFRQEVQIQRSSWLNFKKGHSSDFLTVQSSNVDGQEGSGHQSERV